MYAGAVAFGTTTNHDYHFMTNDTYQGVIDTSGNLGLGILVPTAKLHINGTGLFEGNLKANGQASSLFKVPLTPTTNTQDINWNGGNSYQLELSSPTSDVTLTFSNPEAGATYLIKAIQKVEV